MTFPHGTVQRYWQDCKCDPCHEADREYRATQRAEKQRARNWGACLTMTHDTLTREEYYRVRP